MNEIEIYDDIGPDFWGEGITAGSIKGQLDGMSGDVTVSINSYGGDVFEGLAISNILKNYDKGSVNVRVDGIAASAASVIAMGGSVIEMPSNSVMMIHDPWTMTVGSAEDMLKTAEALDSIKESIVNTYLRHSSLSAEQISQMMSEESWLTAKQAIEMGFATDMSNGESALRQASNRAKAWLNKVPEFFVIPERESVLAAAGEIGANVEEVENIENTEAVNAHLIAAKRRLALID